MSFFGSTEFLFEMQKGNVTGHEAVTQVNVWLGVDAYLRSVLSERLN